MKTMQTFFSEQKKRLTTEITRELQTRAASESLEYPWATDAYSRLTEFAIQGKMIRGGLVALGAESKGKKSGKESTRVGAAFELLHSGILIHDDIMDRDRQRRGMPTIFAQYIEHANKHTYPDAYHYGESMGTCVGIVAYFVAQQFIADIKDHRISTKIAQLAGKEMAVLGLGQMQDVHAGYTGSSVKEEDVLRLYRQKTGRYSFSLPLMAGGILAGVSATTLREMEKLGDSLGIVFQLQDDLLNIFGTSEQTGKPVGSDIRERKQTWLIFTLRKSVSATDREKLHAIFSREKVSEAEVTWVTKMMHQHEIHKKADAMLQQHAQIASDMIRKMHVTQNVRTILLELVTYLTSRTR